MRRSFAISAPLLLCCALLAGCVVPPAGSPPYPGLPPVPMPPEDACGAPDLQGLVGQQRSTLDRMRFAVPLRVIEPGMAVTMDYSAQRLNIELDAAGRIQRVYCG